MYRIALSKDFESNLLDIVKYYSDINLKFAMQFDLEIRTINKNLELNPLMYSIRHKSVRRVNLKKFPFCIFYSIDGDEVFILDILHQNRDPVFWP